MNPSPQREILEQEAALFSKYLLRKEAHKQVRKRYVDAVEHAAILISASDQRLLTVSLKHPSLLSLADSGLPFTRPYSELRRRIYVMLAILESDPEYAEYFLPKQRGPFYIFSVGISGMWAVVKAVLGVILIRVLS